jgi:hypothetical protein
MTLLAVNAASPSGHIVCASTTYSSARSGAGTKTLTAWASATAIKELGQKFATPNYSVYEHFLAFDTSALPDAATLQDCWLRLYVGSSGDQSTTDFTVQAYYKDWGTTLETADFVAGADLGALTKCWAYNTADLGGSSRWMDVPLTDTSGISKTGITRIVVTSKRVEDDTTPSGNEHVLTAINTSNYYPQLRLFYLVTYAEADPTGGALLPLSNTQPEIGTASLEEYPYFTFAGANIVPDLVTSEGEVAVPTTGQIWPRGNP